MKEKDLVRQSYNKIAEEYLELRNDELEEMKLLPEFIARIPKGSKILDAGCGGGIPFTKKLSEYFDVTGVDISDKQIELASKNVPKATFIREDMTNLSFPENTFDGILSFYAIIHIPREEHFKLLQDFYRFLKPIGYILLCFNSSPEEESYDDFFGEQMFWSGFDIETNCKLIEKAGFEIIWSKLIQDSLGEEYYHQFVLGKKS